MVTGIVREKQDQNDLHMHACLHSETCTKILKMGDMVWILILLCVQVKHKQPDLSVLPVILCSWVYLHRFLMCVCVTVILVWEVIAEETENSF